MGKSRAAIEGDGVLRCRARGSGEKKGEFYGRNYLDAYEICMNFWVFLHLDPSNKIGRVEGALDIFTFLNVKDFNEIILFISLL